MNTNTIIAHPQTQALVHAQAKKISAELSKNSENDEFFYPLELYIGFTQQSLELKGVLSFSVDKFIRTNDFLLFEGCIEYSDFKRFFYIPFGISKDYGKQGLEEILIDFQKIAASGQVYKNALMIGNFGTITAKAFMVGEFKVSNNDWAVYDSKWVKTAGPGSQKQ